mmetsp:Transcript_41628/g.134577  ORF Transcript_41628/g.134577 Transcript_41628/m.134577 type:complete len:310 (+) Transcript_41628:187-1116(+)
MSSPGRGSSVPSGARGLWRPSSRRESEAEFATRCKSDEAARRTPRGTARKAEIKASGEAPATAAAPAPSAEAAGAAALGWDASVALLRGIAGCAQLRFLDLRGSQLSQQAAGRLANVIKGLPLVTLSLADCFLGEGIEPILDAISVCRSLVYLNLRLNVLSGIMGIELCRALDASVSLTDVDVSSNHLSDDFGRALGMVLATNETLWKVNLTRNPLGIASGDALLLALKQRNDTIVELGDISEDLLGLGLQNRMLISSCLDANREGLTLKQRPTEVGDFGLHSFKWEIIDDPQDPYGRPPPCEPMLALY